MGVFGYFATSTQPSHVVRIRLSNMTRVDAVTFSVLDEAYIRSAIIDSNGEYGYFGTFISDPGRVMKVRLSDMTHISTLTLESGENAIVSAVTDGAYGYFCTDTSPGHVVRIRLSNMTRVDAVTLGSGENKLWAAIINSNKAYGYFGTNTNPGRVVKVHLPFWNMYLQTNPNWFLCDGSEFNDISYADLFNVLDSNFLPNISAASLGNITVNYIINSGVSA